MDFEMMDNAKYYRLGSSRPLRPVVVKGQSVRPNWIEETTSKAQENNDNTLSVLGREMINSCNIDNGSIGRGGGGETVDDLIYFFRIPEYGSFIRTLPCDSLVTEGQELLYNTEQQYWHQKVPLKSLYHHHNYHDDDDDNFEYTFLEDSERVMLLSTLSRHYFPSPKRKRVIPSSNIKRMYKLQNKTCKANSINHSPPPRFPWKNQGKSFKSKQQGFSKKSASASSSGGSGSLSIPSCSYSSSVLSLSNGRDRDDNGSSPQLYYNPNQ